MKRKSLAILLCMLLSMVFLTACGGADMSDSEYVGKWIGTTAEYSRMEWDVASLLGDFTIEFKADGTVVVTVQGEDTDGKWSETEGGVIVDEGTDGEMTVKKVDDRLSIEQDGMTIYFEKEGAAAADAGVSE